MPILADNIITFDDSTWREHADRTHPETKHYGRGLIPAPDPKPLYTSFSAEPFPDSLLIPPSEQAARAKEQKEKRATLLHLRDANYDILKSLDQNGYGLCWAFSSTKAIMYVRAIMGPQYMKRLAAYWVAGRVKSWRDQGGWGEESLDKIGSEGVPEDRFCPTYSSKNDTAETRANAALHKAVEWWVGSSDRTKATQQMISALLWNLPCICDFNWLSHSMCVPYLEDPIDLKTAADNSWGESSDRGLYRLAGSKAIPDGLWIPRVSLPNP